MSSKCKSKNANEKNKNGADLEIQKKNKRIIQDSDEDLIDLNIEDSKKDEREE